jgi:hypothetical protein
MNRALNEVLASLDNQTVNFKTDFVNYFTC